MKKQVTFAVSFFIRSQKTTSGAAPVYTLISLKGERTTLSTKQRVAIKHWSKKGGRAKSVNRETDQLNLYLDRFKAHIFNIYQELVFQHQSVSLKIIKNLFLGIDEKENDKKLLEVMDYHNERGKDLLEDGTLKNYFTTRRYMQKFLKQKIKVGDIPLSELNYKFLTDFEYFLRRHKPEDHQRPMGNNTVMKHIERLRKVINLAIDLEWLDKDPFFRFKKRLEKTDRGFLSPDELLAIEEKKFSIERIQLVRDLFIFSCYTGLAYKDVMLLTADHVVKGINGKLWIATKRLKTSVQVNIPLLPKAVEIIQKYKSHPRAQHHDTLLPTMSNQKLNSYLKEIADICRIKKNLTFHLARHTFATTVTLSNGVPIESVSKMLGHTKISTTQIYARVVEKKLGDDMDKLQERLDMARNQIVEKSINSVC
jgi:site-specific recombinase XerD